VAAAMRDKLRENQRCLYLDTRPMVAGMRSYLAAAGVDIAAETSKGSLVLSSDQGHLIDGRFEIGRMIQTLETAVQAALQDGYAGLWATGDMTFEMGADKDLEKLLEYEWRLEEVMQANAALGGICQYHASTLPREALRYGLLTHPTMFVNETLSLVNPHYVPPASFRKTVSPDPEIDGVVLRFCQS
jgi:hypothetical protein